VRSPAGPGNRSNGRLTNRDILWRQRRFTLEQAGDLFRDHQVGRMDIHGMTAEGWDSNQQPWYLRASQSTASRRAVFTSPGVISFSICSRL